MSVCGLVESIVAVDVPVADQGAVARVLGDVRRVRGWLDSVEVAAAARLAELGRVSPSMFPEQIAADAARVSLTEATRGFDRAKTVEAVPELGAVLAAGETSAGHVDVVTRAMRDLNAEQRQRLAERGDVLAIAAAELPRDEFAKTVRKQVREVCADDGLARLERQKRATRLRTWVDRESGMWCLRGEFDPHTGLILDRRLQTMLDRMFHDKTPDECPTDPLSKTEYLRAHALLALVEGKGGKTRTDITVLIDAKTLLDGEHADTYIDLGLDIDLPIETIRRMATEAEAFTPVITAANGINLHLGRTKRLASTDQRRILQVMYPTCITPDCKVRFNDCQIHHLQPYATANGRTDIDTLGPLCNTEHQHTHQGRFTLTLDEYRNLTITYPDGTTTTTPPPKRKPP